MGDDKKYTLDNLQLYGQGIVDLKNYKVEGFEILSRLVLEDGQIIMPNVFIPYLESENKLPAFDRLVIEGSFKFIEDYQGLLKDRMIHINVNTQTLSEKEFFNFVKNLNYDVNPKNIVFEILEHRGSNEMLTSVKKVKALGYSFAIDDFGKGYSSFERMKGIGVSYIKIDKMFMDHMTEKVEDLLILKSMIAMIRSLELKVIAEGIESREQLEFLYSQNCVLIQGFLFSKPLPFPDLIEEIAFIEMNVKEEVEALLTGTLLQKSFYNHGPIFIQEVDKGLNFIPISLPLMAYLKYPYESYKKLKVTDLIPKTQHKEFLEFLEDVYTTKDEKSLLLNIINFLGEKYEVISVVKWHDRPGRYAMYFEFVDTLQEGDLALMGLSRSYTQAFQFAPVGMIILSDDFKVEKWNACAEGIFLYDGLTMIGKSMIKTLFDQKNQKKFQKMVLKSPMSNTQTEVIESLRKDQKCIFTKWQISAIGHVSDVKRKYVCMVHDVTESLKKDEELKRVYLAMNNSTSMIVMTDKKGDVNYLNPKFSEITGYRLDDFKNKTYVEMMKFEESFLKHAVISGEIFERTLFTKNGQAYISSISVHAVKEKKCVKGYIVVQKDISDEKAMMVENQSIKDVMVQESQRSIFSDLTPGFINEINNPLSAIKTDIDYLTDQWLGLEDIEKHEVAEDVKSHVNLLIKVLKGLKTVVNEVSDDGWIIFDLKDLLEEVLEVTKSAYYYQSKLTFQWDPRENYLCQGNPGSLKKSFIHLIINASEAVKKNNTSQAKIIVKMQSFGDELEVTIEDNGIGMTKETLDQMYEPLYTTQKNVRPGLGLSVVKRIIESEHNGEILCQSIFNEGTKFKILLKVFQRKKREEV